MFNKRVAEALAVRGHNVTMVLMQAMDDRTENEIEVKENVKLYRVNGSIGVSRQELEEQQASIIFEDYSMFDRRVWKSMQQGMRLIEGSCRNILNNRNFLTWLQNEHFDLAFVHVYQACPIGLVRIGGIPTWIWLNSSPLVDHVAQRIGVPTIPSYVPPLAMENHDSMNFYERTKSLIGHLMTSFIWDRFVAMPETELFRELVDPTFPNLIDLAEECPLVMVNSNEMYELPRPSLAKVINIGGLDMQMQQSKSLPPAILAIADRADGIIIFSFGSIAPIQKMPRTWKDAFFKAFSLFPRIHFFVRYTGNDING
ncbi:hypothetical protein Y032_0552g3342 [Ancylostoma ceylanicum]|uniref:glucuronosyltransferase n=1 Tax=Ancylostoma ceylanicum TaxID=53326 RepID=A0A016WQE7_9BILA|nr:hypothetical protein Y032_0552g3342 [Ancylostoma ceylanicum]